jgi:hypothetical protein
VAEESVIREAKLFEAGTFRERGISFTESDLDAIVAGYKQESATGLVVPIRVQHGRSPWEGKFGKVVEVWRVGKDLMGKIAWPKPVWDFLCTMGTKSLSVGFDWRQRRLREVSVVDQPRVLTAQAFSDSMPASDLMLFSFDMNSEGGGAKPMEKELEVLIAAAEARGKTAGLAEAETQFADREKGYTRTIAELKRDDAKSASSVKLAMLKSEGKLPPACEKYAEAILIDGVAEVTFADGGHMTAAEAFIQFMTHMPKVVEIPGSKAENDENKPEYTEEHKALFAELGVTEEEVTAVEDGKPIPKPAEKGAGE